MRSNRRRLGPQWPKPQLVNNFLGRRLAQSAHKPRFCRLRDRSHSPFAASVANLWLSCEAQSKVAGSAEGEARCQSQAPIPWAKSPPKCQTLHANSRSWESITVVAGAAPPAKPALERRFSSTRPWNGGKKARET